MHGSHAGGGEDRNHAGNSKVQSLKRREEWSSGPGAWDASDGGPVSGLVRVRPGALTSVWQLKMSWGRGSGCGSCFFFGVVVLLYGRSVPDHGRRGAPSEQQQYRFTMGKTVACEKLEGRKPSSSRGCYWCLESAAAVPLIEKVVHRKGRFCARGRGRKLA